MINHQPVAVNLSGGFWEAVYPVTLSDHGTADYLIAFSDFAGNAGDNVTGPSMAGQITLDNSEKLAKQVFSLPIYPDLSENDQEYILLELLKIIN